jgi:hypothetical protein
MKRPTISNIDSAPVVVHGTRVAFRFNVDLNGARAGTLEGVANTADLGDDSAAFVRCLDRLRKAALEELRARAPQIDIPLPVIEEEAEPDTDADGKAIQRAPRTAPPMTLTGGTAFAPARPTPKRTKRAEKTMRSAPTRPVAEPEPEIVRPPRMSIGKGSTDTVAAVPPPRPDLAPSAKKFAPETPSTAADRPPRVSKSVKLSDPEPVKEETPPPKDPEPEPEKSSKKSKSTSSKKSKSTSSKARSKKKK